MSDIAIRVENLGKLYRIGRAQKRNDTLRDALMDSLRAPLGWFHRNGHSESSVSDDTIWALKDVSFEVKRGEVVGIIGQNGAGKSTLLKILSRITEPTNGRAIIDGRVGSLLEVGTGFHPELTGRENIYLNGAVLGMKRSEIDHKFDEIVAFAEIERFLDTPVKHYSSGMYVRLAFAVAAHLEPEILLVDEVLSVGDAAFQKKCLGKMGDVAKEGRTVLFVSHNMSAVSSLCSRGILLKDGLLSLASSVAIVVQAHLRNSAKGLMRGRREIDPRPDLPFRIKSICTTNEQGDIISILPRRSPVIVRIEGEVQESRDDYIVALDLRTIDDVLLFRTHDFEQAGAFRILDKNSSLILECTIPPNLLPANTYRLGVITAIAGKKELQNLYPALELEIVQDELLGGRFIGTRGMLTPECAWKRR